MDLIFYNEFIGFAKNLQAEIGKKSTDRQDTEWKEMPRSIGMQFFGFIFSAQKLGQWSSVSLGIGRFVMIPKDRSFQDLHSPRESCELAAELCETQSRQGQGQKEHWFQCHPHKVMEFSKWPTSLCHLGASSVAAVQDCTSWPVTKRQVPTWFVTSTNVHYYCPWPLTIALLTNHY